MAGRRFVVSCLHCKRIIVTGRITDDNMKRLRAHLFACCPGEVANLAVGVEATLRHFRVLPTDSDEPPPNAA